MHLDRRLADLQVIGDIFIAHTLDHQLHNLLFTGGQHIVARLDLLQTGTLSPLFRIHFNGAMNTVEHCLVIERLLQKINRSILNRPDCHGDITMTGDNDDRRVYLFCRKPRLQIQAADSRHTHISDKAA